MAIMEGRMGFFNARLECRMIEVELSAPDLARRIGVSYEQVRKLILGRSLPSNSRLEKVCTALHLNKPEMSSRVMKDKIIFRFGDAAWEAAGINPRAAPFYILLPLLSRIERQAFLTQIRALAEWKCERTEETQG